MEGVAEVMQPTTRDAYELFARGNAALARVEHNGIAVDEAKLRSRIDDAKTQIKTMTEELKKDRVWETWRKRFGHKTRITSYQQLGEVVFGILKYPSVGTTATGKYKTDESSFEHVDLPFVKGYFEMQKIQKAVGLMQDYLGEVVDGFIHPFFNLTGNDEQNGGAVTFRGSSNGPNFQNIPNRLPKIARMIRECFVPRPGRYLIEADFGALEFCGAACFWKDPGMVAYASDPKLDIHRDMAAQCFACEVSQVHKQMRQVAKNKFVFPLLYGSYYPNIAPNLWEDMQKFGLTLVDGTKVEKHLRRKGVKKLGLCDHKQEPAPGTFESHIKGVEGWFNREFPTWSRRKEEWWGDYKRTGFFDLMTGFRVRGDYSRNFLFNCPIQGPMFHCLLWCLIELQDWLDRKGMEALIVGQIHDCILVDCPERELQRVLKKLTRLMTRDIREAWDWIIVPLKAEVDVVAPGETWYDKKPWAPDESGVWAPKGA